MWNIAYFFTAFFFFMVLIIPFPQTHWHSLKNAIMRNVSVGGGKGEAVRTQLGQTDTVHCLHFRRGGGRAVAPSRLYLFKLKYTLLLSLWHIICLVSWSALLSLRFIAFEGSQDWRIQFFLHFFSLHSAAGTTATSSRVVKVKICHVKVW